MTNILLCFISVDARIQTNAKIGPNSIKKNNVRYFTEVFYKAGILQNAYASESIFEENFNSKNY
jgi:hypothetical protein